MGGSFLLKEMGCLYFSAHPESEAFIKILLCLQPFNCGDMWETCAGNILPNCSRGNNKHIRSLYLCSHCPAIIPHPLGPFTTAFLLTGLLILLHLFLSLGNELSLTCLNIPFQEISGEVFRKLVLS